MQDILLHDHQGKETFDICVHVSDIYHGSRTLNVFVNELTTGSGLQTYKYLARHLSIHYYLF